MNKILLSFLITSFALGLGGNSVVMADNNYVSRHYWHWKSPSRFITKSLLRRIGRNSGKIQGNSDNIDGNTSDIADNFSQIQDNRSNISINRDNFLDLDSRVSRLEKGPPAGGGGRVIVDVDCVANPDTLLQSPINGVFAGATTYSISGACNGPLYVTADGVRFEGVTDDAAIVLPADTSSPDNGAVFGDGAHDLRIRNLLIDVSAFGTAAAEGTDAAGVYARNAFVWITDSTIVGGQFSINPFRNAIVRLEGEVNITDFVNEGISVGDLSVLTGRGQVNVSSTRTDGSYLIGVDAYRSGVIDLQRGINIELPPRDESNNFFPSAIVATQTSHLRIRNSGTVAVNGEIFASSSSLLMQGGTLDGDIFVTRNASAQFQSVDQISGINFVELNATAITFDSSIAEFNENSGGIAEQY